MLKSSLFGYSKASVAKLEAEKDRELSLLKERLLQHKAQEAEVVSLVLEAKRTAQEIIVQAQTEADEMIRVAHQEAQKIVASGHKEAKRELLSLRQEVDTLKRLRVELMDTEEAFKRDLQVNLYRCIDAINKVSRPAAKKKPTIVLPEGSKPH